MCVSEVFKGPGEFRKVREDDREKTIPFLSQSDLMVPSSDQSTKRLTMKVGFREAFGHFFWQESTTISTMHGHLKKQHSTLQLSKILLEYVFSDIFGKVHSQIP